MSQPELDSPSASFPDSFVWGVATASFQIEGGAREGGRGPSVWDAFCARPGTIADGSNGDVACDHYHRWAADVDLMADLGVDAYRFSMAWPRVQPEGRGAWNDQGFDFYDRLIDRLLARNIRPYLTLNHWDLPQALQPGGGWANRDTVHRFVDYAREVNRRLGDRLVAITTHNEPWVMAVLGHETGIFAPGERSRATAAQVSHHLLLSHGLALQALRADGCRSDLGIVLNLSPFEPATDSEADRRQTTLEESKLVRWYMDPLFKGHYPEDVLVDLGADAPRQEPGDLALIRAPLDFLGINYYTRAVVSARGPWDVKQSGLPLTDMGWEVYPRGLTDLLVRLNRDYPLPPTFITENGSAFVDTIVDGRVHDVERTRYLADHIQAVADALRQGVPMAGYMVWSLLDNFEWASGYAKRFGIVHVDYATQQRTLKDSARWYRDHLQRVRAARLRAVGMAAGS